VRAQAPELVVFVANDEITESIGAKHFYRAHADPAPGLVDIVYIDHGLPLTCRPLEVGPGKLPCIAAEARDVALDRGRYSQAKASRTRPEKRKAADSFESTASNLGCGDRI
jgi:hypothetical protein